MEHLSVHRIRERKRVNPVKKAILAVSFGTSYPDTLEQTIAATERALAAAYPDWEVRRAFTSGMIIKKLRARDGLVIDNVAEAMEALVALGYSTVEARNALSQVKDQSDKPEELIRLALRAMAGM